MSAVMKKKPCCLALLSGALLWFVGCTTVSQTGRSALHLVPEGELASMSSTQFDQLKQDTPVSRDRAYNAMVQRVGERIAYVASADMPNAQWEFVVFDDDSQINAFAMPGGKVAVYTGILEIIKNDAELAVVMGHEVAHVAAGHGNERMSHQMLATGSALALNFGTAAVDMDSGERALLLAAFGAGTSFGVILPYSRYHESEADEIGLIYAAKAGYDPRAAIPFWERMEAQAGAGAPPEFLSTHPAGSTRIRKLNELMPRAMDAYRNR
ncbi:MAG: putative Zn-dependent protease [Lentimonas sp.]|jgi:predicted Zn-dependent protease